MQYGTAPRRKENVRAAPAKSVRKRMAIPQIVSAAAAGRWDCRFSRKESEGAGRSPLCVTVRRFPPYFSTAFFVTKYYRLSQLSTSSLCGRTKNFDIPTAQRKFFVEEITITVTILCCTAFFIAGFVDAIAGGGGLITVPALLLCGVPPHTTLGTVTESGLSACFFHFFFFLSKRSECHLTVFHDFPVFIPCKVQNAFALYLSMCKCKAFDFV